MVFYLMYSFFMVDNVLVYVFYDVLDGMTIVKIGTVEKGNS